VTPTAGGPVLPTTEPTAASSTPRPAERLLLDSMVTVLVDRLNVRAKPTVDSKIVGVVEKGDFLLIEGYGPFSNDGYRWYQAVFLGLAGEPPVFGFDPHDFEGKRGWIAVAKGTTKYVERLRPRCPPAIDVHNVSSMLGSELLACFGSDTIELTGTFGCGGCGGARTGSYEPGWLAYPPTPNFSAYPIGEVIGHFVLHFPPGGPGLPDGGSVIRVRGHFDDPASETCVISIEDPMHPGGESVVGLSSEAAHLVCAQQFVVESTEVLGMDPGFTFG